MKTNGHKKHGNTNQANYGGKWITPKRRRAVYMRDDLRCVYCDKGIEDGIVFTLDHLLPQELGGTNATTNLVTCCKTCNSAKGIRTVRQFFVYLRDNGVNTDKIGNRVRRNLRRKLKGNFKI